MARDDGKTLVAKLKSNRANAMVSIVGGGTSRAYVWVGSADGYLGHTTVNALRRVIRQHELAQKARASSRRHGTPGVKEKK